VSFLDGPVRVSVPASSANLGPGFDSLGLALELRDELTASVTDHGLGVEIAGEGAGDVARDETHLVIRAMRAAFGVIGEQPDGLLVSCYNRVPHARGLGSSSAAIVAGVHLARGLVKDGADALPDDAAFRLAAGIEGHPDNVAAACFGGLTVAGQGERGDFAVSLPVVAGLRAVAFVPPTPLETSVARGLLPDVVPHRDAAADAGRAALLVAALTRDPAQLGEATRDWLHQEYRRPAIPESLALIDRLRRDGHAAVVSGAGPTVLVLTDATDLDPVAAYRPDDWRCLVLEVATRGVTVTR
jgi:homoserine kinase